MQPIRFACPILAVKFKVGSELLDEAGRFTRFVLQALASGYTAHDINATIEVGEYQVLEEINYLCKTGFASESSPGYALSEKGLAYVHLIEAVEKINALPPVAAVNCFSGAVQAAAVCFPKEKIDNGALFLPDSVNKQLFYNKNYGNAREFVLEQYSEFFTDLDESLTESIYVQISSVDIGNVRYLLYELNEVPAADYEVPPESAGEKLVYIDRNIERIFYMLQDERLEKYRNALDSLDSFRHFDKELLTPKALSLLALADMEKEVNKNPSFVLVDSHRNEVIRSINVPKAERPSLHIPDNRSSSGDFLPSALISQADPNLKAKKIKTEKIKLVQSIPFSLLREAAGESL